jgi:hypothetical protein
MNLDYSHYSFSVLENKRTLTRSLKLITMLVQACNSYHVEYLSLPTLYLDCSRSARSRKRHEAQKDGL